MWYYVTEEVRTICEIPDRLLAEKSEIEETKKKEKENPISVRKYFYLPWKTFQRKCSEGDKQSMRENNKRRVRIAMKEW